MLADMAAEDVLDLPPLQTIVAVESVLVRRDDEKDEEEENKVEIVKEVRGEPMVTLSRSHRKKSDPKETETTPEPTKIESADEEDMELVDEEEQKSSENETAAQRKRKWTMKVPDLNVPDVHPAGPIDVVQDAANSGADSSGKDPADIPTTKTEADPTIITPSATAIASPSVAHVADLAKIQVVLNESQASHKELLVDPTPPHDPASSDTKTFHNAPSS
ncbi:hypothetical protein Dimus_033508 [Dionaea muscipula]